MTNLRGIRGSLAALGRESGSNLSAGDNKSTADLSIYTLTTLMRGEVAGVGWEGGTGFRYDCYLYLQEAGVCVLGTEPRQGLSRLSSLGKK